MRMSFTHERLLWGLVVSGATGGCGAADMFHHAMAGCEAHLPDDQVVWEPRSLRVGERQHATHPESLPKAPSPP